ncbi:hypothetical protein [Chelatococcus reniformis]|uniref:Uncharacterized protein n=1 Tax=Chelatococcus reniformis TaxID=1494448 RepID=A0A916UFT0_9HYPH|nr:hypothetical protein [Chelatococcus reniformis]GGC70809.1 hypothetical protein GCM10010994_31730 [Chelatococcus reniformis]
MIGAYGCGRHCGQALRKSRAPLQPVVVNVGALGDARQGSLFRAIAVKEAEVVAHEAGHVVGAALYGRRTLHAQVGHEPHVAFDEDPFRCRWEEPLAVATLGGPVAGGMTLHNVAPPPAEVMTYHLAKARAGGTGTCDECRLAELLVVLHGDEPDARLAERWRAHWRHSVDLFDRLEVRCQVNKLARALRTEIHLDGSAIDRIIDRPMLERVPPELAP